MFVLCFVFARFSVTVKPSLLYMFFSKDSDDTSEDEEEEPARAVVPEDPMLKVPKEQRVFIHYDTDAKVYSLVRPSDNMTVPIPKISDPILHVVETEGMFVVVLDSESRDPKVKSRYAHALLDSKKAVQATGAILIECKACLANINQYHI